MSESISPNTDMWKNRIATGNASIEMVTIDDSTMFTGQTLKIDDYLHII